MEMEHGDIENPTGNAVIYWRIKGNNKLFKNAEVIASNFVISPLQFKNETLMVNFPPVLIESYAKLMAIVEANNIDLIKGGELYIEDNIQNFSKFYKKHIEKYNGIIQQYLIAYKEKNEKHAVTMSLPKLINQAGELMETVRRLVKNEEKREEISSKIAELREIQQHLNSEMKGFDLNNIIHVIDKPDMTVDRLVNLYKQKFLAIFLEDYEKADSLKREIIKLEQSLFR